ncbi:MAG: DUF4065 domain-containing protein [Clostridia bacterium]|nr:DUF4065 domain-containing protein [Clostridia bacterium]
MTVNTAFCEECRDDTEYEIIEKEMTGTVKGKVYHYTGREAKCMRCSCSIFVPEITDDNLKALYDVYRKENGIVPLDIILQITKKYAIGKRPLSLLLGWGEQTFSRFCDGDVPSRQYSEMLTKIYEDPYFYAKLLEDGRKQLKSDAAYEKSRKAVDRLVGIRDNRESRIDVAIQYLLSSCEDITPLALQKALYYIQGFYYAFYDKFLFAENCEAWVHGPVYREVYLRYRDYRFDSISQFMPFDNAILTEDEKAVFESVSDNLCCYSGKVLERFTHSESPWIEARGDLLPDIPSNRIISMDSIGRFFKEVKNRYNMLDPKDIRAYAADMFSKM